MASVLKWLKNHQNPDGKPGVFSISRGSCPCPDLGTHRCRFKCVMAMALLPFLGAGHTHREGEYQREVQAGLYYLLSHQKDDRHILGTRWQSIFARAVCHRLVRSFCDDAGSSLDASV